MANKSLEIGLLNFDEEKQKSTNLISRKGLWARLTKGPDTRAKLVDSHLSKSVAFQIQSLRERGDLSQEQLAEKVGMNQNTISRLESPWYGRPTIRTLKRLAAAFDVALVVRFVPFSQFVDWVSGTPFQDRGLSTESLAPVSFGQDRIDERPAVPRERKAYVTRFHRHTRAKQANQTGSAPVSTIPQIAAKERRPWIPKQALSGHGQAQMRLAFGSAGCSGAVAKIIDFPLPVGAVPRFASTLNLTVGRGTHYGR